MGQIDLYDADIAQMEAAIALEGRIEDGLVAMELQMEDLGLPRRQEGPG